MPSCSYNRKLKAWGQNPNQEVLVFLARSPGTQTHVLLQLQ